MQMQHRTFLALLAAAALAGCGGFEPSDTLPLAEPDRELFDREAAPLLMKRCGDVSCHGDGARPFALYAVGRRRLRAADTFSTKPLTEVEVDANFRSTLGFLDAPRPEDTTLLRKALATGGEAGHKGGAVFAHRSDPECRAIVRWIEGVRE